MNLKEFLAQFEGLDPESLVVFKEPKGYRNRNKKLVLIPIDEKILIKEVFICKNAKRSYFEETNINGSLIKAILIPQFDLHDL